MKIYLFKTLMTNIELFVKGIRMYQWSCLKHSIHLHFKDLNDRFSYWEEKENCKKCQLRMKNRKLKENK